MSKLTDLAVANPYRTIDDWLDDHDEAEKGMVLTAMRDLSAAAIYPILTSLESKPFPFSRGALSAYMKRIRDTTR